MGRLWLSLLVGIAGERLHTMTCDGFMGCNLKDIAPAQQTNSKSWRQAWASTPFSRRSSSSRCATVRPGRRHALRDANGNPVSPSWAHTRTAVAGDGHQTRLRLRRYVTELKADEMAARQARRLEAEAITRRRSPREDCAGPENGGPYQHYSPQMVKGANAARSHGRPVVAAEAKPSRRDGRQGQRCGRYQDWDALLYGSPVLVHYGRRRQAPGVVRAQSIDLDELLETNDQAENNWWIWPS